MVELYSEYYLLKFIIQIFDELGFKVFYITII